jgi:hypothetical protein
LLFILLPIILLLIILLLIRLSPIALLLIRLLLYKIQRDGNRLHNFGCGLASCVGAVGHPVGG